MSDAAAGFRARSGWTAAVAAESRPPTPRHKAPVSPIMLPSGHIWASPSRDPNDNRVRLKRIERRSDGWQWGRK